MKRRGFTALELIVVIMIIAILAAAGYPRIGGIFRGYREMATTATLNSIRSAISEYHDQNASWPADLSDIMDPVPENTVTGSSQVTNRAGSTRPGANESGGWIYYPGRGWVFAANNVWI